MRKYRVLWPHVGDKEYAIDDMRIADPNDVAHLVTPVGSMLEDVGEADEPTTQPGEDSGANDFAQLLQARNAELAAANERAEELQKQLGETTDRLTVVEDALAQLHPVIEELRSARDAQNEHLGKLAEQIGSQADQIEKVKAAQKPAGKVKPAEGAD